MRKMVKIHELPTDCLLAFLKTTTLRDLAGHIFEFPSAEIFQATLVEVIPSEEGAPGLYEFRMWVDDDSVGTDHKTFLVQQDHVEIAVIPAPVGPKASTGTPLPGWKYTLYRDGQTVQL